MSYLDRKKNSLEKNKKNTRTSFSKEFVIKLDKIEKLTEKAYLG